MNTDTDSFGISFRNFVPNGPTTPIRMAEMTELRSVDAVVPLIRSLYRGLSGNDIESQSDYVDTDFGKICVVKCGAPPRSGKPYIVTFHDIGMNFQSNFQAFFNYCDMRLLIQSFTVLNIHAPGQEDNAPPLPEHYTYPTMDQLAQMVDQVCKHYGVKDFVGLGVGAGANVLSRYALKYPAKVDGLFLINPTASVASWTEWLFQKMNVYHLASFSGSYDPTQVFPQSIQDYMMWHHFGRVTEELNHDLIRLYKQYFSGKHHNARNLSMFIDAYIRRTDMGIERGNKERNFQCTSLILVGALSPHIDDSVNMNGRLNPDHATWMKLSDCGMVLEEQPGKVCEAFRLFLQGLGYALSAYERRRSSSRQQSTTSDDGHVPVHIVENPIHC